MLRGVRGACAGLARRGDRAVLTDMSRGAAEDAVAHAAGDPQRDSLGNSVAFNGNRSGRQGVCILKSEDKVIHPRDVLRLPNVLDATKEDRAKGSDLLVEEAEALGVREEARKGALNYTPFSRGKKLLNLAESLADSKTVGSQGVEVGVFGKAEGALTLDDAGHCAGKGGVVFVEREEDLLDRG